MMRYSAFITCFLIHTTFSFREFYPNEILKTLENSCALCYLSADVSIPQNIVSLLISLSSISYQLEPSVQVGFIDFNTFRWRNNLTLKEMENEELLSNDIVLFPKTKLDRTCLLPAKAPPPKVYKYKGSLSDKLVVDFINNYCNTYRTVKGGLTIEGLHRQEINHNLFSVSSISSVTAASVFKSKDEFKSCNDADKSGENSSCVEDSSKSSHVYKPQPNSFIPECERIKVPTKEDFFHTYLKLSKPVIIENGIENWPAFEKWSNNFLRNKYHDKDVHIKLTSAGEFEGVEPAELWDNYKTFKIPDSVRKKLEFPDLVVVRPASHSVKFSDLVDLVENVSDGNVKNVSAYLEYSSIPDHLPELESDIEEMTFISDLLQRQHLNIWFSDGNTLGKLHFDPFDNLLCQISGRKQVILFEPHDNTKLYEAHIPEAMLSYNHSTKRFSRKHLAESTSMVMSPVDLANVDLQRFPKFAETYPLNCTIDEGDVLFMPAFWWHEVQSFPNKEEKRNLAVNYWYEPFLTKEFPCPTCKLDINPKYRHLL